MAIPQAKFREIVFQLLYSYDTGHGKEEDLTQLLMKELSVTKNALKQANSKVDQIHDLIDELDKAIASVSQSYGFDRIQSVERNILRLGTYELFYDDSIPEKVAITEAMRLARKFGSPESASFVNAILDNLYKTSLGEPVHSQLIKQRLEELEEGDRLSNLGHEIREQENKDSDTSEIS
jgi:N utilization substance protein B